jgi:predicted nucleotidyltransferase
MLVSLEKHRDAIQSLCRRLGVRAMWVFGSALRPDFQPGRSDVDLLVDFGDDHPRPAIQFHELREGLEAILLAPVDIVSLRAVRNPYFHMELEETRQPLYVAA